MPTRPQTIALDGDAGVIDLDARRAARLEKSGPKRFRLGGRVWECKGELPMAVIENFTAGDLRGAFSRILANPDEVDEFLSGTDMSQDDFKALMETVYSLDLGKSSPPTVR
jgi:hypothetical protein